MRRWREDEGTNAKEKKGTEGKRREGREGRVEKLWRKRQYEVGRVCRDDEN